MKGLRVGVYGLGLAVLTGATWWMVTRPPTTPGTPGTSGAPGTARVVDSLSARLLLEPGAPGDATLGIIRLFDARARNGFAPEGAEVTISRAAIEAGVLLETERPGGELAPGTKPVVVRTPADGTVRLQAATTLEVWADLRELPSPGSRVRVSMPIGASTVVSDWVEVPTAPVTAADRLSARARVQRAQSDGQLVATADQLVADAPSDARGYYYRGLALEASGDRAGAIAAYEAALERIPAGGPEPPVALYRRLARLRRAQ